jgi:acetylornithine deacetylase
MIEKIVGFDTTSTRSNLGLVKFIEDYLTDHGIVSHRVPSEDGTKANLYAVVGPNVEGGVVLSGHTDVVPVDGQPWDTDPFSVTERDGKLFGRGTADMKSFYAIGLSLVPEMITAKLKRPILFALSYDEELGCIGAPFMIAEMAKKLPKPRAVIVGEPTGMEISNSHKGGTCIETTVIGHEAHSSEVEQGVSAVLIASQLIVYIHSMMVENRTRMDPASPFSPGYTTLASGTIQGGTAQNILARKCVFNWGVRCLPGEDPYHYIGRFEEKCRELLVEMRLISSECNITSIVYSNVPPLQAEEAGEAEELVTRLLGRNSTAVVSYGTEAGQFQEAGFSTVLCGPGSIGQAHQANEFIEIVQVEKCEDMLRRLIDYQAQ